MRESIPKYLYLSAYYIMFPYEYIVKDHTEDSTYASDVRMKIIKIGTEEK